MTHPLVRKLSHFSALSIAEIDAVNAASGTVRTLDPGEDLMAEGQETQGAKLLLAGIACRYKTLEDGRRQIVSFVLPGDTTELRVLTLRRADHSVSALSPCRIATLSREQVANLSDGEGALSQGLNWAALVDESITREWVVNVGRRTAIERMAHVFCELFYRLRAVGLTTGDACHIHVTQVTLGETLALSAVHVNRTLQELRRQELATLVAGKLAIYDLVRLQQVGMFNPDYLHLENATGA
ncbi:MAG: Crp/Fnr family transcriptional regulator [Steroidobacteraceae bacterium]